MGLRTLAVVALAAWAGWLLFRGVVGRSVPWIGLAIIAVPLVLLGWTERQWIAAEQQFSAVVRTLQPLAPGVHCQRLGETLTANAWEMGHVMFEDGVPTGPAVLSYQACQDLTSYWRASAREKSNPTREQVIAVHVLSHEAIHLNGVMNEAATECRAMQHDAVVAQRLGATPEQGRVLAERYASAIYPMMPSEYVTKDCVKDGPLDKTPGDGIWP
jgi:hypothetical protein